MNFVCCVALFGFNRAILSARSLFAEIQDFIDLPVGALSLQFLFFDGLNFAESYLNIVNFIGNLFEMAGQLQITVDNLQTQFSAVQAAIDGNANSSLFKQPLFNGLPNKDVNFHNFTVGQMQKKLGALP